MKKQETGWFCLFCNRN